MYVFKICGGGRSGKYADKTYESIGPNFKLFGHGKRPETYQNIFSLFVNTSNSSPILLSCPLKPQLTFLKNPKKMHAGK